MSNNYKTTIMCNSNNLGEPICDSFSTKYEMTKAGDYKFSVKPADSHSSKKDLDLWQKANDGNDFDLVAGYGPKKDCVFYKTSAPGEDTKNDSHTIEVLEKICKESEDMNTTETVGFQEEYNTQTNPDVQTAGFGSYIGGLAILAICSAILYGTMKAKPKNPKQKK